MVKVLELNFFQVCIGKTVLRFSTKTMNSNKNKKEKRQLLNHIFENSREYGNFKNGVVGPSGLACKSALNPQRTL